VGEGQKAPNFWMTESLPLAESSPSTSGFLSKFAHFHDSTPFGYPYVFLLLRTFCLRPGKS